jgi:MFS family permease
MVAATVAGILPVFLTGAVAVQAGDDLHFDAGGLGLAVGMFFLAGSATSALLGRNVERLGAGRSLRLFDAGNALVCVAIALTQSYALLLVFLAVGGVMNAGIQPAANLAIVRAVPLERHGFAFGIKQSAMPAGTLLGGLAVPTLALTVGWRWAFVGAALFCAVASLCAPVAVDAGHERRATPRGREGDAPLAPLIVLAVAVALGAAAAGAVAGFTVSGGVAAGIDEAIAGWALTVGSAIGITVRLLAGYRADQREGGHLRVVAAMTLGGAIALVAMAVEIPWLFLLGVALAFGSGWGWPGLFNLAVVRHNPGAPAAATGITQTGTNIGAVLGPFLFGLVVDEIGWSTAWLIAATWFVAAAAMMLGSRRVLQHTSPHARIPR